MALNLSVLQGLRPVKPIDPVARYRNLADLQNTQRQGQMDDLKIQDAQRQAAQGKALHDALVESGGDIEAALPKIAQIAPELYPHYQQIVDQQKQQGINNALTARKAQFENAAAMEGQPAPGATVALPVAQPATYSGQVGEFNPNTPQGEQGVNVGLPPQQISGIPQLGVSGMTVQPQSLFAKMKAQQKASAAKLQDEITLNREKQKAEFDYSTVNPPQPPKPTEFEQTLADFNQNAALTAKYGKGPVAFDKYKQDQQIQRAIASRPVKEILEGPDLESAISTTRSGLKYVDRSQKTGKEQNALVEAANRAGIPAVSKETADLLSEIDNARENLDYMNQTIAPKLAKGPGGRPLASLTNTIEKLAQTDPDLAAVGTYRSAAIQAMRAVAGAKGLRINRAEIEQAQENDIPKMTDTLPAAAAKLKNMTTFLNNAERAHLVKDRSVKPAAGTGLENVSTEELLKRLNKK